MLQPFQALVVDKADGEFRIGVRTRTEGDLPEGDLLIQVAYSSLNYKDALACVPDGNIVKRYPFVPGIDLAGIVVESRDDRFENGDEVLVTGYELGVAHEGGFSQYARVPAAWAVKLPDGLSLKEAMIYGTAGFTAALSVNELRHSGVTPERGPVLVTGATGGVGSMAVAMLAKLGYEVEAVTGKLDMRGELLRLGAARIVERSELVPDPSRPLGKQRWGGAVDCVGGDLLAAVLGGIRYGGAVAASGLAGGSGLPATVFPFILRGVRLIGIDSVLAPMDVRLETWMRLASEFKPDRLDAMYTEISLEQVPECVSAMLAGQSRGRWLVKLA
ncbi:oxidoreductase [Cohnella candidum]|uniref:oxidoreductase n=1 Tax=Cohnella candidum TaxID=2674991 RepID=UPI0019D31E8D|nr:oxidoreductase [Cohnella candidum]